VKKEMNKEAQTEKKEADVPNLQDFLKQLPKGIDAKETSKGTVLRHDKSYIMHITQSPKGIHSFLRTKAGKHLESAYATNKKEIDALVQKINDKLTEQKKDDKKNSDEKTESPNTKSKK
jgi:hypothetical protein